ncbi:hypothetical protein TWF506_005300 [Arthrobotrys conoides]|uniref:BTB domain-containing protein n=1 Tax=Arthrobotrys conoides TaxID=74498 RepID=A0AAN8NJ03_9PEZI
MVRGHSSCPDFCCECHKDCLCDHCKRCHTCPSSINFITGRQLNQYHQNCKGFKHECDLNDMQTWTTSPNSDGAIFDTVLKDGVMEIRIPAGNTYWVHKVALIWRSDYFRCLFSSKLVESRAETVELDDEEVDIPVAVEAFFQYCYIRGYSGGAKSLENLLLHAQVYVFAERIRCDGLKNMALKKATLICRLPFPTSPADGDKLLKDLEQIINLIYSHTSDRSATMVFGIEKKSHLNSEPHCPRPQSRNYGSIRETRSIADSDEDVESISGDGIVRDGFRMLLAAYSALHLDKFRASSALMRLQRSLPDFSSDLILFVQPGGGIKTDESGLLSINFRMAEFSLE